MSLMETVNSNIKKEPEYIKKTLFKDVSIKLYINYYRVEHQEIKILLQEETIFE